MGSFILFIYIAIFKSIHIQLSWAKDLVYEEIHLRGYCSSNSAIAVPVRLFLRANRVSTIDLCLDSTLGGVIRFRLLQFISLSSHSHSPHLKHINPGTTKSMIMKWIISIDMYIGTNYQKTQLGRAVCQFPTCDLNSKRGDKLLIKVSMSIFSGMK